MTWEELRHLPEDCPVIVGGPLCTVASAYLSDPSIAGRMVVMMTDIDGYNGSDPWANYVVATRCKLVNFGASPLWWPQRPSRRSCRRVGSTALPDPEITRSMKEVARRFWERSTRKEKPDRDDGFADGAGTFLLYRPETWTGVKKVRVTGAWSHEDAPEGEYHYLDATGIDPRDHDPGILRRLDTRARIACGASVEVGPCRRRTCSRRRSDRRQASSIHDFLGRQHIRRRAEMGPERRRVDASPP